MRKAFYIFAILAVSNFIIISCTESNIGECGPFNNRFKITALSLNLLKFNGIESGYYSFNPVTHDDTLTIDELYFELDPVKEFYMAETYTQKFSLIQGVYACSPVTPFSEASIDSVQVRCSQDYNSDYKKGVNLIDILDVLIEDRSKGIYSSRMSLKDFMGLRPNAKDRLTLILNESPDKDGNYAFRIEYLQTLDSEQSVFMLESGGINIKRNSD